MMLPARLLVSVYFAVCMGLGIWTLRTDFGTYHAINYAPAFVAGDIWFGMIGGLAVGSLALLLAFIVIWIFSGVFLPLKWLDGE